MLAPLVYVYRCNVPVYAHVIMIIWYDLENLVLFQIPTYKSREHKIH